MRACNIAKSGYRSIRTFIFYTWNIVSSLQQCNNKKTSIDFINDSIGIESYHIHSLPIRICDSSSNVRKDFVVIFHNELCVSFSGISYLYTILIAKFRIVFDNALHAASCLNLSMWGIFFEILNLSNPNLMTDIDTG